MLAVHEGKTLRGPLSNADWEHIWMVINRRIAAEVILPTWDFNSRIDWSTWAKQRGLVACTNEAMANLVRHAVADVRIEEKTFKAWKSGEKVFPNLCTVIIPPGLTFFSDEELPRIFIAQNRLSGEHDEAKFSGKDAKGFRRLLMGISNEFADGVRMLDGLAGIAGFTVKVHVKNTA